MSEETAKPLGFYMGGRHVAMCGTEGVMPEHKTAQ